MTGLLEPTTIIDAASVILAAIVVFYSVRLIRVLDRGASLFQWRWWCLLPLVTIYGLGDMMLLCLSAAGLLPEWSTDILISSFVLFWAGLAAYIYYMYRVTLKLKNHYDL